MRRAPLPSLEEARAHVVAGVPLGDLKPLDRELLVAVLTLGMQTLPGDATGELHRHVPRCRGKLEAKCVKKVVELLDRGASCNVVAAVTFGTTSSSG